MFCFHYFNKIEGRTFVDSVTMGFMHSGNQLDKVTKHHSLVNNDIMSVQLRASSDVFKLDAKENHYGQLYTLFYEIDVINKEYSIFVAEEFRVEWKATLETAEAVKIKLVSMKTLIPAGIQRNVTCFPNFDKQLSINGISLTCANSQYQVELKRLNEQLKKAKDQNETHKITLKIARLKTSKYLRVDVERSQRFRFTSECVLANVFTYS